MFRFNLVWLFSFTAILAALLALSVKHVGIAYLATCFTLPMFFALLTRLSFEMSHTRAVFIMLLTAISICSVLTACAAYFQTFIEPSPCYVVGNGWGSVAAAAFCGAVVGFVFGSSTIPIYFMLTVWLGAFENECRKAIRGNRIPS